MLNKEEIENRLKTLPKCPGIYKMLDEEGKVIYVGKAKDLSKRVKQYFQKNYEHSTRTKKMLENVRDISIVSVDSELEATILENNTIKQLQPKYNVIMKDDKSFVYIKITKEDFPRIQIVRQSDLKNDGSKYIGPKTAKYKVKDTFKLIKKIFPFRHCNLDIVMLEEDPENKKHKVRIGNKTIKYPCLDYYIKRCSAPCIGKTTKDEYADMIKSIENFLEGKADDVLKKMRENMMELAKKQEYEKAAKMRDKIMQVEDILEKQKVSDPNAENKDIINYCIIQGNAYFNLFQIRDGKLIGQENFTLTAEEMEENEKNEVLEAFLLQYYELATDIPKEILIPHELLNNQETEEFIQSRSERKIHILIPKIGTKNKLLDMSLKNAQIFADRNKPKWQVESDNTVNATKELQKVLGIEKELKRIECYDISHLSGTDTVGSMVVFINGAPKNDLYRQFKIRTVVGKPDDFKSIEEVLTRRFTKISEKIALKDYKFKKANKAELKELNLEGNVYILANDEKIHGTLVINEHSDKVSELTEINLNKEDPKVIYKLLKEAVKKAKGKRIYTKSGEKINEHLHLVGFEEINKNPSELGEGQYLAYDSIKNKEDKSFSQIPDLVIIDGGKGQLTAGTKVFNKLEIDIPYISLAKRLEEIFIPGVTNSLILEKNNEALKLLQRARDEAHRFAITFNRKLRSKRIR